MKCKLMASSIESHMDELLIEERLSKPKPLKVTDGVSRVGIVVDSITNLGERAKKALNLPQSVCISIKTQDNKLIKSKMDLDNLKPNEILTIIPKGPVNFTPENLLKRLRLNPKSLALFTDRDFVTISEINVDEFENQYPPKRLEELKTIAEDHIAKDQELRDTLDLVQLSKTRTTTALDDDIMGKIRKIKEYFPNTIRSDPTNTKLLEELIKREYLKTTMTKENLNHNVLSICYSPNALQQILENVKKDYEQIFKISDKDLEALAFMYDDGMTLEEKQIKAAASRRLRIKRNMKISKEYLQPNNHDHDLRSLSSGYASDASDEQGREKRVFDQKTRNEENEGEFFVGLLDRVFRWDIEFYFQCAMSVCLSAFAYLLGSGVSVKIVDLFLGVGVLLVFYNVLKKCLKNKKNPTKLK